MEKIIMISGVMVACIANANCQMKGLYPRATLPNSYITYTRPMNIDIQIDPYNRFTSTEDLKRLKKKLEDIMFCGLQGYRMGEKSQIMGNINNILLEQTDGLSNLNDFIYKRFSTNIKRVRLSKLNKRILKTFDRKSSIYSEAYNKLAQIGGDISSYPLPAQVDRFGNVISIPHYSF